MDRPELLAAWGEFALAAGDYAASDAAFAKALALTPDSPAMIAGQALAAAGSGDYTRAVALLREAVRIAPHDKSLWNNLGNAIGYASGGSDPADATYQAALRLDPADTSIRLNYARALRDAGRLADARGQFRLCLRQQPKNVAARLGLALVLDDLQARDEAEALLAEAADDDAVAQARACRANYDDSLSPEAVYRIHAELASGRVAPPPVLPATMPSTLRVGLLSPDFRDHPVAVFVRPLLAGADPARLKLFVYDDTPTADATGKELRAAGGTWRHVAALDDSALARQVANDRIDVLVELAGHTAGNRLAALGHRMAPVQATWLGYPNTTGVPAIDLRLVDAVTDPPDRADALASERLARVDGCFLCWRAPDGLGLAAARPDGAPVAFGSANNFLKVGPRTIALWARVLAATPGSRLVLKSGALFEGPETRAAVAERFAAHGIDAGRLEFRGRAPTRDGHLAFYDAVDIALDPLNYNGTTTTCEALWMGVPVVALAGDRHAARVGASLLAAAGLPDLVAADPDGYVALAQALAGDPARRAELRRTLRSRLSDSALCDAASFAGRWEAALRAGMAAL